MRAWGRSHRRADGCSIATRAYGRQRGPVAVARSAVRGRVGGGAGSWSWGRGVAGRARTVGRGRQSRSHERLGRLR